jgi:two-component system LytT family sensor kinase
VSAERKDGMLVLMVKDDGPGIPAEKNPKDGVGISSTRARLERLYGAAHRFALQNGAQGGLIVTLTLPFQWMAEDAAEKKEALDSK